jgi:hypothetical protein
VSLSVVVLGWMCAAKLYGTKARSIVELTQQIACFGIFNFKSNPIWD